MAKSLAVLPRDDILIHPESQMFAKNLIMDNQLTEEGEYIIRINISF